jgi:glycine betaine catabolism B
MSTPTHIVKILSAEPVTHNVRRFRVEKPEGYTFNPGQATEVSINLPEWKEEKRPFTFTSLNEQPFLEFTIKIYSDHNGVTNQLGKLSTGDELIIRDVWGAIEYKGPGYFIAGGAGITPFIAIFRQLKKDNKLKGNKLFFSNRTANDIIIKDELQQLLGSDILNVISDERAEGYYFGMIDELFLRTHVDDFTKHFYVCGPPPMINAINTTLARLGASPESVVFEK